MNRSLSSLTFEARLKLGEIIDELDNKHKISKILVYSLDHIRDKVNEINSMATTIESKLYELEQTNGSLRYNLHATEEKLEEANKKIKQQPPATKTEE